MYVYLAYQDNLRNCTYTSMLDIKDKSARVRWVKRMEYWQQSAWVRVRVRETSNSCKVYNCKSKLFVCMASYADITMLL